MVRLAAWLAMALAISWVGEAAPMTLVEDGKPQAALVVEAQRGDDLDDAAADLEDVIERMSGARLAPAGRDAPGAKIVLRDSAAGLSRVGYRLRTEGGDLVIEGSTAAGVVNGIYGLLQDHLGARWYIPGPLGEYIPRRATIELGNLDERREPAIPNVTRLAIYPPDPQEGRAWGRRNRLAGFQDYSHGHNWNYLIPQSAREAHPEWFALIGGERREQLCTTHPEVIRIAIERTLGYFAEHPEAKTFSLSPSDSDSFCQCERCRALDRKLGVDPLAPGGQVTDRLLFFFNQIAAEVAKQYPDRLLCFYAYLSHTDPPRVVKPLPNLMPIICHTPWEFCHAHPITADCEPAVRFRRDVLGWRELCEHVGVYDYYGHFSIFGQWPIVHSLRHDIPFLAGAGIEVLNSETHGNWWTQPLNMFVAATLPWDLDADVDALVRGFCSDLFGPAADPVYDYLDLYEREMAGIPLDAYRSDTDWRTWPSPDLMEQGRALLDRAAALAQTAEQKERVRKLQAGHEIYTLEWRVELARKAGGLRFVLARSAFLDAVEALPAAGDDDVVDVGLALRHADEIRDQAQAYTDMLRMAGYATPQQQSEALERGAGDLAVELGFLTEWNLIGPFPYEPGDLGAPQIPVDRLHPAMRCAGLDGEVGWRTIATRHQIGVVDLRELVSEADWVSAYAACWVELPRDQPITLRLGSNDGAAVWLDGEPLLVSDVARGFTPDLDRVSVMAVEPGWHLLVVKIANHGNLWKFALRFTDLGGRPQHPPVRLTPPD